MSFILMMIGILAIALGAILIGFGIPINEFSLGNTLILAGTVTAMGGLVTFAVSRAVAQLSRIADLMATRPIASPVAPAVSTAPPVASSPGRGPQPRAQQGDEFGLPEAVEPVRPPPRAAAPMIEEPTPAAPARAAGWRPPRPAAAPKPAASRASTASDNPFDTAWPDKTAPSRREPTLDLPAEPAAAGTRAEAATVLKSGVVDGMAYTLYTDGSIEAELAQGVVRFGSIEELRNHLEKSA
jgi:hypothetical protein